MSFPTGPSRSRGVAPTASTKLGRKRLGCGGFGSLDTRCTVLRLTWIPARNKYLAIVLVPISDSGHRWRNSCTAQRTASWILFHGTSPNRRPDSRRPSTAWTQARTVFGLNTNHMAVTTSFQPRSLMICRIANLCSGGYSGRLWGCMFSRWARKTSNSRCSSSALLWA
jgi:hypothetical protein